MNQVDKAFYGKRVLITGGYGFLGTNLTKALSIFDCQIIRLGQHLGPKIVGEKARISDQIGDVRNLKTWEKVLNGVDIVFHLAAQTSEDIASANVAADWKSNVLPMVYMLEVCRQKRLHPVVIFAGTIAQAGKPEGLPIDESQTDNPITVYTLHKLMAENYLKYYIRSWGTVTGAILRLAYVYGRGPNNSIADRGILNQMIKRAVKGQALTVYRGKGKDLRDYVLVDDAVEAFLLAVCNISKLNGGHYVIGTGRGYTISEAFKLVAERVKSKTGKNVKVVNIDNPGKSKEFKNISYLVDSGSFTKITGWKPGFSLEEGIDMTADYFLGQK